MKIFRGFKSLCFLLPFMWLSCDTSNSIDQPDYFVKYFGVEGDQEGVDMIVNDDGTFFLFGNSTLPEKNQQLFLVKADANGVMLWSKFFGGDTYTNQARDIEMASDGRLVMVANGQNSAGDNDVLLIITDQDGNKLDSMKYGYAGYDEDVSSVTQIMDGFILTGSTSRIKLNPSNQAVVPNDQRDIFNIRLKNNLVNYNQDNNNTWNESFLSGTFDCGIKIYQIEDDLFYFFGYTNQQLLRNDPTENLNFVIYQVNREGEPLGAPIYAGTPSVNEQLTSVSIIPSGNGGGYILTGIATEASGENRLYVSKLNKQLSSKDAPEANIAYQRSFSSSLGVLLNSKAAAAISQSSGFFVLSNDNNSGNQDFCLIKSTNEGEESWKNPSRFIFGGSNLDNIGSVAELPDGKIVMIGTFSIGDDAQKKMALIKVNKDGKFRD